MPHFPCVFLSETRLATLKERIAHRHSPPTLRFSLWRRTLRGTSTASSMSRKPGMCRADTVTPRDIASANGGAGCCCTGVRGNSHLSLNA